MKQKKSINKSEIIVYKHANRVNNTYVLWWLNGAKYKKRRKKKDGQNQLRSPMEALPSGSFASSFGSTSAVVASIAAGAEGHLGFIKNSGKSGSEESSIPSGTFGWSPQKLYLNAHHP